MHLLGICHNLQSNQALPWLTNYNYLWFKRQQNIIWQFGPIGQKNNILLPGNPISDDCFLQHENGRRLWDIRMGQGTVRCPTIGTQGTVPCVLTKFSNATGHRGRYCVFWQNTPISTTARGTNHSPRLAFFSFLSFFAPRPAALFPLQNPFHPETHFF